MTTLAEEFARHAEEQRRTRLYSCSVHAFDTSGIDWEAKTVPERLTCVICREWLPAMEATAYARGFAAAGGDPETVIEGFGR